MKKLTLALLLLAAPLAAQDAPRVPQKVVLDHAFLERLRAAEQKTPTDYLANVLTRATIGG